LAIFQSSIGNLSGPHRLTVCTSIAEVWAKLAARLIPPPNLIFIDLELSRSYDHELVQIVKSNDDLAAAPVVVFAESAEQDDILITYRLAVACLVVFPKNPELRQQKIQACLDFWSNYAELPELRWRSEV
jgi:CheY-like chemotaxis protein